MSSENPVTILVAYIKMNFGAYGIIYTKSPILALRLDRMMASSTWQPYLSCAKDFRNLNSMVTKKIVGSNNFSAQFIKIISHYKKNWL